MRKALLILVFALVAAACGGTESSETQQPAASSTETPGASEAPDVSEAPDSTPAESSEPPAAAGDDAPDETAATASEPSFDGPPAPDFELALADGTAFTLTGEQKPVYMVFWAEW